MSTMNKAELKGLDQFQARIFKLINWFLLNKRQVAMVLLPVVLVAAAGFAWQAIAKQAKNKRLEALAKIESVYSQENEQAYKAAEAAAQAAGKSDPLKLDSKIKPDHSGSLASYLAFAKENSDKEEGWIAGLRATAITAEQSDGSQEALASALAIIEPVIARSTASSFHQVTSRMVAMSLLEDLKRYDDAAKQAETLLGLVGDDLKPKILLTKARLDVARNALDEARVALTTILEKHDTAAEAAKARAMLGSI